MKPLNFICSYCRNNRNKFNYCASFSARIPTSKTLSYLSLLNGFRNGNASVSSGKKGDILVSENQYNRKTNNIHYNISRSEINSILNAMMLMSFLVFAFLNLSGSANAFPFIQRNCLLNLERAVSAEDAHLCKYGYEVDACGTFFCTEGPKSYCDGKFDRYGVCGDGLMCNTCNRCTGCSTKTFECWYDEHCIWSSD